ncbi:hypothetical protein ACTA71_011260 [Dictyostelium dimigraforme]
MEIINNNNNNKLKNVIPYRIQFIYELLTELKINKINIIDYSSPGLFLKDHNDEEMEIIEEIMKKNYQLAEVNIEDFKFQTIYGNFGTDSNKIMANHLIADNDVIIVYSILHQKLHGSNEIQNKIINEFINVYNLYLQDYDLIFQKQFRECKICNNQISIPPLLSPPPPPPPPPTSTTKSTSTISKKATKTKQNEKKEVYKILEIKSEIMEIKEQFKIMKLQIQSQNETIINLKKEIDLKNKTIKDLNNFISVIKKENETNMETKKS